MSEPAANILVTARGKSAPILARRLRFSAHKCFGLDGKAAGSACLEALGSHLLIKARQGLALYGTGPFYDALLAATPALAEQVKCVIHAGGGVPSAGRIATTTPDRIPAEVKTVFLCETRYFPRQQMRKRLTRPVEVIDPDILPDIASAAIPERAWAPDIFNIYPIDIPEILFKPGMDVILMDCPARNLALMPNGIAYVHNALKKTTIKFQTIDTDIITYHRYHMRRIFDEGGKICLPDGREMPVDPWQAEHYELWADPTVVEHFRDIINEVTTGLIAARPKVLAMSIQQCNEVFSRLVVNAVKQALPETQVVVGGFSCYNADVGRKAFPESDFMCIGEADLVVGPLLKRILAGERPANTPGVLSRYDSPEYEYATGPMPHNLDAIEFPKYEWANIGLYRNFNNYQIAPILASRGCRWSRCTFCAERFYWRIRSAGAFVDELEWLMNQGCHLFMFNESDLNGMPDKLLEICDEIVRRKLPVKLAGQLRIHKRNDRAFFDKLKQAGFVALRFGVDAFSESTLRLQMKGYTTEMVSQNLKDCWEAGIYTEVNWVIGVPGETEEDITEGVDLILRNKQYIGRLANINTLVLANGSVYWLDPESHNIKFRSDKGEIYAKYARAIPEDLWFSENPYIDGKIRRARFRRIILALRDGGFNIGAWASKVIDVTMHADDAPQNVVTPEGDGTHPSAKASDAAQAARIDTSGARRTGSALQVNSMVAVDSPEMPADRLVLLRFDGKTYGTESRELAEKLQLKGSDDIRADDLHVSWAEEQDGQAEFIAAYGEFNMVEFRGKYYGCPHGILVDWRKVESGVYPMLIVKSSFVELRQEIVRVMAARGVQLVVAAQTGRHGSVNRSASGAADLSGGAAQRLIRSVSGYDIYSYEGIYYGVPARYGQLRLDEVDPTKFTGVIRDVSIDAVESEVRVLADSAAASAAE